MPRRKYFLFVFCLAAFGITIFSLNQLHLLQQGIYRGTLLPLATNLYEGKGYSFQNIPAFYPMWGYIALLWLGLSSGTPEFALLAVQLLLSFVGIYFFYKLFSLTPSLWHIPFFTPYLAVTSVKWPTAIVISLIIPFAYFFQRYSLDKSKKSILIAGILLGILLNFRSEFLYLPPFLLLLFLFRETKSSRATIVPSILIVSTLVFILLLPWGLRSKNLNAGFRLTSTNGGLVSYISLGQLPNNPWDIAPKDTTGYIFVRSHGIADPFSPQGDSLLKIIFYKNVRSHPLAFFKKMMKNSTDALLGGVYTGEYSTRLIPEDRVIEINKNLYGAGIFKKISIIFTLNGNEFMGMFIEYLIFVLFKVVWYILIVIFLVYFVKLRLFDWKPIGIVTIFLVYTFGLVSFLQYETRHMNILYIFLLGLLLAFIQEIRQNRISLFPLKIR
ncbi:MAG: hypothetical protein HY276_02695 [Ignavibacteriales bacterium]|nr:hypothetical protein [Ignavibacteriales bacterium]